MIETDPAADRLQHYSTLYVTMPHMTASCATAIAAWVHTGGQVFATAGAGLLDESNQTNAAFAGLLGVEQTGVFVGHGVQIMDGSVSRRPCLGMSLTAAHHSTARHQSRVEVTTHITILCLQV